jgi:H+/Cl- antiporter ClcA
MRDLVELWALGAVLTAMSFADAIRREGPEEAETTRELERDWRWHATMIATCAFWPVAIAIGAWLVVFGRARKGSP